MRLNLLMKPVKYTIGFTILGKPHWKHFIYSLKGFIGDYKNWVVKNKYFYWY